MSKRKFNNDLGKHPKDKLIKKIRINQICIPYDDEMLWDNNYNCPTRECAYILIKFLRRCSNNLIRTAIKNGIFMRWVYYRDDDGCFHDNLLIRIESGEPIYDDIYEFELEDDDIYHPERFTFDKKVNWA